jgi:hypothetical protein
MKCLSLTEAVLTRLACCTVNSDKTHKKAPVRRPAILLYRRQRLTAAGCSGYH